MTLHAFGRRLTVVLGLVLIGSGVALADASAVIKQAPPLPPPTGDVVYVSTVSSLQYQITAAPPGRTIMVQPGNYYTTKNLAPGPGVTIRGATGNRDDVTLWGAGMHNSSNRRHVFWLRYSDITIADLTIRDAYYHGIQIAAEYQTDRIHLYNLKILDCGERFIKGSTNHNPNYSPDDVVIEYCWLEQIQDFIARWDNSVDPQNYIGGIDAMWCNRWIIRDCVFKNIRGLTGGARGGIFIWNSCKDSVVERNLFIGCDRSLAIGNPSIASGLTYHMDGGIVRNNLIVRGASIGLELCMTVDTKVYNNTIYSDNAGYNRTLHIYGSTTSNLQLYDNIIRGLIHWNGTGPWPTTGSIIGSTPTASWFVEPLVGDLRLTDNATLAIGQGQILAEVTDDYFAAPRDAMPDIGAHESDSQPNGPQVVSFDPPLAEVNHLKTDYDLITIGFDRDVTINESMVSVVGVNTGPNTGYMFLYDPNTRVLTLAWVAPLPDDTYVVTISDAVSAGGLGLDGEQDMYNPSLPSGDGAPGGDFVGLVHKLVGDINQDRSVNVIDLLQLAGSFATTTGDPNYDAAADLNADGSINVIDLLILANAWTKTIPVGP